MNSLLIKEIFESIQGEGARAGEASIFIRLAGCNLSCSYCDTDHKGGRRMTVEDILTKIKKYTSNWIVWTGGEPTMQLNDSVVEYFNVKGYYQAIETNGTNRVPFGLNHVACSPKVRPNVLKQNFDFVHEFRYPFIDENDIPKINELPLAKDYFLSPVFERDNVLNKERLAACLKYIAAHPFWRLSIQIHKLLEIK